MGHLFSRAFRRITSQCTSQSSRNQESHNQQQQQNADQEEKLKPIIAQSIPVGQSIDSAEYTALEETNNNKNKNINKHENNNNTEKKNVDAIAEQEDKEMVHISNNNENKLPVYGNNGENKQGVEEAVIKIQALVRGHLTRKALKDAHQHSAPLPTALGQSQFDEDSLIKNQPETLTHEIVTRSTTTPKLFEHTYTKAAPSAVFLSSSPSSLNGGGNSQQQQSPAAQRGNNNSNNTTKTSSTSPLESIAELIETTAQQQQQQQEQPSSATFNTSNSAATTQSNHHNQQQRPPPSDELAAADGRRKLSPLNTRSASSPSKIEVHQPSVGVIGRKISTASSSDANASIDICCDTPASASIDILDHNIKPIDKIASVLHHHQPAPAAPLTSSIQEDKLKSDIDHQDVVDHQINHHESSGSTPLMSATSDSLESEEAAAIRIQSAFRGYRTRKNSPYRTRSPKSAAAQAKRNALTRQQEATILHEQDYDDDQEEEEEKQQLPTTVLDPNEQLEASQIAQSEGRRSSRPRQREPSIEPIIQTAPSMEEFTTTEDDTVREVGGSLLNQQQLRATSNSIGETTNTHNTIESALEDFEQNSLSFLEENNDQMTESLSRKNVADSTLDETGGLTAALEVERTQDTITTNQTDCELPSLLDTSRRPSGKESDDISVELDTDSSYLGAALSLNSEDGELQQQQQSSVASNSNLEPINENKLLGANDELEFEARKLVDEMQISIDNDRNQTSSTTTERQQQQGVSDDKSSRLEEAVTQLESVLEDATAGGGVDDEALLLDEEEQRTIELESDDIERRDPRGHASEERCKSPQIRTEPPTLAATELDTTGGGQLVAAENQEEEEEMETIGGGGLTVDLQDEGKLSGRSSPALESSTNVSSEEEEDNSDQEQQCNSGNNGQQQQQLSQQQKQKAGKNKKRNNRNKRKARK